MKFSKKTAHRLIVSLAMLAPVIYLFGAMFLGLAGAHGEQLWSQDENTSLSYDLSLQRYAYIDSDTGEASSGYSNQYAYLEYFDLSDYVGSTLSLNISAGTNQSITMLLYNVDKTYDHYERYFSSGAVYVVSDDYLVRFYIYSPAVENPSFSLNISGDMVPAVISSEGYSDFIFGQFFPHDNFVERMGFNALSANPIGFAPFGTFLSYLDVNVFHASGSQVALMLYGMVYWSLHVVIADLVYHVAVFIPNIIQRVFDWFGQKGLEDD